MGSGRALGGFLAIAVVIAAGCNTRVTDGDGPSTGPVVSGDGRFVAFTSEATNLVEGDDNGVADVFVRDRTTGQVERITDGNGPSRASDISYDGRFVAFESSASDLVAGDSNGTLDVFLWDRSTGTTWRITNGNGPSRGASVSDDGLHVTFVSDATDLVPGDADGHSDVYSWHLWTGMRSVSGNADAGVFAADMSGDGRIVVFQSIASNIGGDPGTWDMHDVFAWDRQTGVTVRLTDGDDDSADPIVSRDGRHVAFASLASNLVPGQVDANGTGDVYVVDRATGSTTQVTDGDGWSFASGISGDGRYVAIHSSASNLVADDDNGQRDVFLWDRSAALTRLSSGDGGSWSASVSDDGEIVAYETEATDIGGPGDENGVADVVIWSRP